MWEGISNDAKDLIKSLIVVDPRKRLTGAQVACCRPRGEASERVSERRGLACRLTEICSLLLPVPPSCSLSSREARLAQILRWRLCALRGARKVSRTGGDAITFWQVLNCSQASIVRARCGRFTKRPRMQDRFCGGRWTQGLGPPPVPALAPGWCTVKPRALARLLSMAGRSPPFEPQSGARRQGCGDFNFKLVRARREALPHVKRLILFVLL